MKVEEMFLLKGKVAVVTGATGELGKSMSRALGAAGASVAVVSRTQEKADALAAEISGAGGTASGFAADVQDRDAIVGLADAVKSEWGTAHILVNSAGGNHPDATAGLGKTFFELPAEALQQVVNLNLMGTIFPCQVFGEDMAAAGQGSIINISSMAAMRPLTRVMGYAASKAAVDNFTQWLSVYMAQEHSPSIRVNAIAPGFFETTQNKFLLRDKETMELSERGRKIIDHTPMGRFGEADDLVGALLYLASSASRFVTGTVLPVDGGFSAFSGV